MLTLAFALLVLGGLAGGLLSFSYLSRIRKLESRLDELQQQLGTGATAVSVTPKAAPNARRNSTSQSPTAGRPPTADQSVSGAATATASAAVGAAAVTTVSATSTVSTTASASGSGNARTAAKLNRASKAPGWPSVAISHLQQYWMIWLGALCIGLAGVFLVRYSIDQGLLGPTERIFLAVASGIILHALAQWLLHKTGQAHPAFAALAGGASIILYAAILAALRLYDLLSPGTTFALLALIALATMALSLLHGPVLAIIGLLGAYVVPLLVSDGSGQIATAMVYSLIISAAALLLMRYVYRVWLLAGIVLGALSWWLLSLTSNDADGLRSYYLTALTYGMLAVPLLNWYLRPVKSTAGRGSERLAQIGGHALQPIQLALVAMMVAQTLTIAQSEVASNTLVLWSPMVIVAIIGARTNPTLAFLPWLTLASQCLGWLLGALEWPDTSLQLTLDSAQQNYFLYYAMGSATVYSALSWWTGRSQPFARSRTSLMIMAPLLWLALAYILVTELSVNWQWSLLAMGISIFYLFLSRKELQQERSEIAVWLILGGHLGYSLAVAMLFREASLTLALATQLISLAWLIQRFGLHNLDWLVKLILAIILLRLTVNPWLLRYPADVHWSLWTYGGSLLCAYLAMLITPASATLRKWLGAATIQLLVLFLAAETRYWLYDGEIFRREYSLIEAAVNSYLWGGLGLAYYIRADAAQTLRAIYLGAARILLIAAACNQILVLSYLNPLWSSEPVGSAVFLNVITLAYGLPALMAYLVYRFYAESLRKLYSVLLAASGFMFVSMTIRHIWQGGVHLDLPFSQGELYSYSAAWLTMAVAAILYAGWRQRRDIYLAGMGLLLVVVAKLFLIDMAGLQGLWRVASFMGLGLSLLALAYLYQRQVANNLPDRATDNS